MDEEQALLEVARQLQLNAMKEAEASKGYVEQLAAIAAALTVVTDTTVRELLQKLIDATNEKISDELEHNESLIAEFIELTGIVPSKD